MAHHASKLIYVCLAIFRAVPATSPSAPPPAADDIELICHPDNAADCYPRVFRATSEFKPVRPGQDLPSGLHVRLNVYTGEKEAKINDRSEQDPALAGLPVDKAVVVVDPEPAQRAPSQDNRPGAPAYDSVGKIKEPTGPEAEEFDSALISLRGRQGRDAAAVDDALDKLSELSHDMYYGLKIAEDLQVLSSLLCMMSGQAIARTTTAVEAPRALLAARTISASLQNNPAALMAVERHWPTLVETGCFDGQEETPLRLLVFRTLQPDMKDSDSEDQAPSLARARLSAVKGLIKSPRIQLDFLEQGSMQQILRLLLSRDHRFREAQATAAALVTDTFLDESMGATLGRWPGKQTVSSNQCNYEAPDFSDDCWHHWVERVAEKHDSDPTHWSLGLLEMLTAQIGVRNEEKVGRLAHDEL